MFESLLGTLVLAAALSSIIFVLLLADPILLYVWEGIPMEWQYSDDCDFNDEDKAVLVELEKQAKITLGEWNLSVNVSKTEYVTFCGKKGRQR